ncbi:hypothetical protein, partial [Stieleria sp.]|uniref:hypothetical protein n=1 Tax=Stieleria sp. TaxID=2795976 RepID=UPI003569BCCC
MFQWQKTGAHRSKRSRKTKKSPTRRSHLETLEARRLLAREVSGTLAGDDDWSGTIHVTGDVSVPAGSKLTIQPDTVVKFAKGKWLTGNGAIEAVGLPGQPVVFTSALDDSVGEDLTPGVDGVPYPGHWESLYLRGPNTRLDHVEVRYAGDTDGDGAFSGHTGSIETFFDSSAPAEQTQLSNVVVTHGYSNGVNVFAGSPSLNNVAVNDSLGVPFYFDIDADPDAVGIGGTGNAGGDRIAVQAGTLTENRSWDYGELPVAIFGGDYVVGQDGDSQPVTLSVAPGTVIKVPQARYLHADQGKIHAVGTTAEPIVFTAATDDSIAGDSNGDGETTTAFPGYWESIYLDSPGSVFENVEVRYAGDTDGNGIFSGQTGSFEVRYDSRDPNLQNRLTNVRISRGYSNGVNVRAGAPNLDTVHVEDSLGYPFYFDLDANPSTRQLTGRDNAAGDRIVLQSGTLTEDRTWDYGDLPLHVAPGDFVVGKDAASNPVTLTVAAGTVIKMSKAQYLWSHEGTIVANGTPSDPIIITAITDDSIGGDSEGDGDATAPYPGYWESIYLDGPNNVFENVEIRYAGDTDGNGIFSGQVGGFELRHAGDDPTKQTRLTNVRISDGYSNGINVSAGDPILQNIHTEDNLGVPFYFELDTDPDTTGLSGRGNLGGGRIVIQGGTLTEDRTWDYGDLPIHLTASNLIVGADAQGTPVTLTIAAGTVIKMPNAQYFESRQGTIHAVGTAEDPIVFTAATDDTVGGDSNGDRNKSTPFPGYWESLYLYGPSNVLEHVQVRYAGDTDGNGILSGQVGSIELDHAGTTPETQNRLTNVTVSHGYSNGINVLAATPTLENVDVFKNVGAAYYFELDAAPQVTNLTGRDNLGGDRIAIQAGTLTQSRVWDYGDLPIHIISGNLVLGADAESNPANLDIAAGTVIKIDKANYVWARDGALRAPGTPAEPIYFTATSDDTVGGDVTGDGDASSPYPGFWESIYIDGAG